VDPGELRVRFQELRTGDGDAVEARSDEIGNTANGLVTLAVRLLITVVSRICNLLRYWAGVASNWGKPADVFHRLPT